MNSSMQDKWQRLALDAIYVPRKDRQRRKVRDPLTGEFLNRDGLLESVAARGVLNAIIVRELGSDAADCETHFPQGTSCVLVAGERRLEASRECGLPDIPVRYTGDLSPIEHAIIELEENLKRSDLPWQDEVSAIAKLHEGYKFLNPEHTVGDTEKVLGLSQVREALRVAPELGDSRLAACTRMREAYNILARRDERATADAVSDIIDGVADVFGGGEGGAAGDAAKSEAVVVSGSSPSAPAAPSLPFEPPPSLLNLDFLEWSAQYSGPTFNLIHCDFPYGITAFSGPQSGRDRHDAVYDDGAEVYWACITALCSALPRLMSHSAHLMFWLSADIEIMHATLERFRVLAPSLKFWPKPLVWHKSDNVGVLSDPRRGPRHIYEVALIASQEDRCVVRATSDCYSAPTDKSLHPSTKPEPMLRYFFQALVDERTRLFDPTCGSGAALRAAESLGAERVLGLEKDPEHFKQAETALRTFRSLRRAAR